MNAHQPKLEQLGNDAGLEPRIIVHLADERPDALFGETATRLAKQLLVF